MADSELIATRGDESALGLGVEVRPAEPQVLWMPRIEEHSAWPLLSRLNLTLIAGIPMHRFKVRDLLRLEVGQIVESIWPDSEDVPLKTAQVQIGWCEFEVVEQQLAIRLTRLA